jgi:hypothetical protein
MGGECAAVFSIAVDPNTGRFQSYGQAALVAGFLWPRLPSFAIYHFCLIAL